MKYSISFKARSQSVKGQTKDFPVIWVLVSNTKFKDRKFRYSTGEVIHSSLWSKKKKSGKKTLKPQYQEWLITDVQESVLPSGASSFFRPATHKHGNEIKLGYLANGQVMQGTVLQAMDQKLKDLKRKIEIWMDMNAAKATWDNDDLKAHLEGDKPVKGVDQVDVFKKWEEIINATQTKDKDPISAGTKRAKTSTLSRVKEFFGNKPITFESFNQEFYDSFMKWMADGDVEQKRKPMLKNTRGKHVKEIKSVLRRAMKWGLPVSPAFLNNDDFKTVKEDSDEIYLDNKELIKLIKTKLPPHLARVRDVFVAASYVGARYGDWKQIHSKNIVHDDDTDFLRYQSSKTDVFCTVKLHPVARLILDKYKDQHNGGLPVISNQKTNDALKSIAEEAKLGFKASKVKTHTARRSFCTNQYLSRVPIPDIMNASGHQSEEVFKKYVRLNDLERALNSSRNDKSSFYNIGNEAMMEVTKSLAS